MVEFCERLFSDLPALPRNYRTRGILLVQLALFSFLVDILGGFQYS